MKSLNGALSAAVMSMVTSNFTGYTVAYEGKTFTKPANAAWLAMFVLPATMDALQTTERLGGILQIDINHPLNAGSPALFGDADKVLEHFAPGKFFETAGQGFTVRKRELSPVMQVDGSLKLSVSISYRATTNL